MKLKNTSHDRALLMLVLILGSCLFINHKYELRLEQAFQRGKAECKAEYKRKVSNRAEAQVTSSKKEWMSYKLMSGGELAYTLTKKWWNNF